MCKIQGKITQHMYNQDNVAFSRKKIINKGKHQNFSMLELSDKNFKVFVITTLNEIKKNIFIVSKK